MVELHQLEQEKSKATAKAAAAAGSAGDKEEGGEVTRKDAELETRIAVVRDGIYKRMKLLATWADLDDEQV